MLLLAIETSTISCSVALMKDGCIVAEITTQYNKNHSSTLMPNIEKLFKIANTDRNELDVVAVSAGPGSFTGLRIGITTAKILSYALKTKLILVPTLTVLAASCFAPSEYIMPVIDAQQEKVYCALYRWLNGELTKVEDVRILKFAELNKWIKSLGTEHKIIITGETNILSNDVKDNLIESKVFMAHESNTLPTARNVAILAKQMFLAGKRDNCLSAKPFYIRNSAAEEKLLSKGG